MSEKPTYMELKQRIKTLEKAKVISKLSEDKLLASMQKLKLHVEQTPLAVIDWNLNQEIEQWNKAAEKMFGYKRYEAIGQHASFIVPDASKEYVAKIGESLINQTGGLRSSNDNIRKDGKIISCEWYNTPLIGLKGESVGVASLVMDVTERRQTEKQQLFQKNLAIGLSKTTTLKEMLKEILLNLFQLDEFDSGGIYLINNITGNLEIKTSLGLPQKFLNKVKHYKSNDIQFSMIMKGFPIYLTTSSAPQVIKKNLEMDEIIYLTIIPIEYGGSIIGSINLASHSHDFVTNNSITILETIGKINIGASISRVIAEEGLRESEERFTLFMDYFPGMAFIKDKKSRTIFTNEKMDDVFGVKNWTGRTPLELFPTDIAKTMITDDQKTLNEVHREIIETIPDKNGINHIYQTHKFRIEFSGKPDLIGGIALDITQHQQANEMLLASEKRFRKIIENVSGIAIQGYNEKLEVIFWNHASEKLYGYTEAEALRNKIEELIIPQHIREQHKMLHTRWIKYGKKIPAGELDLIDKNGQIVPVFSSYVMHETIHGKEMFCIDVDMRAIRKAEKALRKSEEHFKLITVNTSALVSIHDSAGNYIFASPSHARLGFKPEDLIERPGITMMEKEDVGLLLEYLEKARQGKIPRTFLNYRLKDNKGGIHYYRGSFDAVYQSDDSFDRVICVGEDITELRQAQAEKMEAVKETAEAKKLALVGQVAGKIAHDFNNLLSIIMGNSELSLLDCKETATRKTLELIFEQSVRGKNLIKNLVAFAKDQELKQEFFNLNEKIDLVLSLLRKDFDGINVIREYGYRGPEILADPGMIEHALLNIIQNSIHATSLVAQPEIIIKTSHGDEQICIEITDNGCGIPQKFLRSIFEPSFTLKGSNDKSGSYKSGIKGTGYGLANVKKYVQQHKGNLSISSDLKRGTDVTIILPIIKKELTKKEIANIDKEKVSKINYEKYILLVEDEVAISEIQYKILTNKPCNHKVDIANNGQIAIDLFSRNEYDFVSLDYILPGGFSGMDVYNHIRKTNKTIPILFISGNIEFLESIKELKQKDLYLDHLSKPCKNLDYVNGINKLISIIR